MIKNKAKGKSEKKNDQERGKRREKVKVTRSQ